MTPFQTPLTVSQGGCGFQTGAGAVLNTLKPAPSESLLIFGLGSVGLTALMAAKHLGLETMIAVDIEDSKLELAKDLGATHVLNSKSQDILSEVLKITGRGASFAIDCTGVPSMIELLVECIHPFGTASSIGDAPAGVKIKIDPLSFVVTGKTFVGLVEGDSIPQKVDCHRLLCQQDPYTDLDTQFLPELIDLHKCGKFPVDRLVSIYSVKDLDRALEDMESGKVSFEDSVVEDYMLIATEHQNRDQMGHLIREHVLSSSGPDTTGRVNDQR